MFVAHVRPNPPAPTAPPARTPARQWRVTKGPFVDHAYFMHAHVTGLNEAELVSTSRSSSRRRKCLLSIPIQRHLATISVLTGLHLNSYVFESVEYILYRCVHYASRPHTSWSAAVCGHRSGTAARLYSLPTSPTPTQTCISVDQCLRHAKTRTDPQFHTTQIQLGHLLTCFALRHMARLLIHAFIHHTPLHLIIVSEFDSHTT